MVCHWSISRTLHILRKRLLLVYRNRSTVRENWKASKIVIMHERRAIDKIAPLKIISWLPKERREVQARLHFIIKTFCTRRRSLDAFETPSAASEISGGRYVRNSRFAPNSGSLSLETWRRESYMTYHNIGLRCFVGIVRGIYDVNRVMHIFWPSSK